MSKTNQTAAEVIEHEDTDESAADKQVAELKTGREMQTVVVSTPLEMLGQLVAQGADIETITKMMDLAERHEANEARKAFAKAMSGFKSEIIEIVKDKHVSFATSKGTTEYWHASLHVAVMAAVPMLSKYGLFHSWKTKQEDGEIIVSCVIAHEQGHSEATTLSAGADQSGGKNSIQGVASTVSYLERYTFLAATGLTVKDMDDDGAGAGDPSSYERISEDQIKQIKTLLDATHTDQDKFLEWCEVDSLDEILTHNFAACIDILKRKKKVQEKQAASA